MKNITITADDETARWVRIEAAKHEMSVSRFVSRVLREKREGEDAYEAAMKQYLAMEPVVLHSSAKPYPSRDELHDRASIR